MRWYRLTEEERRVLRAPVEIEGFGLLALTLFDRWERDAVFVLVRAFIDESGIGGEPRMMLGGLVAQAHRWHAFNHHWQRLLDKEEIEFSHIVAMENGESPFEDWDKKRCGAFVDKARVRINKNCDFGVTTALSLTDYREHYRNKVPTNINKDSAFGVCARQMIESVTELSILWFGPDTVVNFVFENNQHFEHARQIFTDLKAHVPEIAPNLGKIAPGEKIEFAGLQGADLVASLGRRAEPTAQFRPITDPRPTVVKSPDGGIRLFHVTLHEKGLEGHCRQAVDIFSEKRRNKRQRGWEKTLARRQQKSV